MDIARFAEGLEKLGRSGMAGGPLTAGTHRLPEAATTPSVVSPDGSFQRSTAGNLSAQVEAFARDLARIGEVELAPPRTVAGQEEPDQTSSAFELKDLTELGEKIGDTRKAVRSRAENMKDRMRRDWGNHPMLCRASVFEPLGLELNEVRLTKALAWLMTPSDSPLRQALLAEALSLVCDREIQCDEVNYASCRTAAEEPVDGGRIDIYLDVTIARQRYEIAIEAKVGAPESDGQLGKYATALENSKDKVSKKIICFLTPDGRSARTWPDARRISYADLLHKWFPVLKRHESKNASPDDASPLARLLLADIARRVAEVDLVSGLDGTTSGIPTHLERLETIMGMAGDKK